MGIYEIKKPKKINVVSVTVTLGLASIIYVTWTFLPVWWPIFQETGIMKGICNDMYRQFDNEALMQKLLKESARTGLRLTKDNFVLERVDYAEQELTSLGIPDASRETFHKRGKECRLTLNYTSIVHYPGLQKTSQINWNRTVTTDLALVKY